MVSPDTTVVRNGSITGSSGATSILVAASMDRAVRSSVQADVTTTAAGSTAHAAR